MSALRNVEDTIGGFVERTFGRLFRGHVQPVELARKLAREMEDHKTVSVSRVYVPNEYVIYLSAADGKRFASFEGALTTELGVYLSERARHEGLTMLSKPVIRLEVDTDLRVGEYGIACRVVDPPAEARQEVDAGSPDLPAPVPVPVPPVPPAAAPPPAPAAAAPVPEPDVAPPGDAEAAPIAQDDHDALLEEPAAAPEGTLVEDGAEVAGDEVPDEEPPAQGDPAGDAMPAPPEEAPAIEAPVEDEAPAVEPPAVEPAAEKPPAPEPAPPAAAPAAPPVPPAPTPLPPPGDYEPLVGVSGTQIMSAADARSDGFVAERMTLTVEGRPIHLTRRTTTIGRSRDCDIVLGDANASRRHAEVRHIGLDYFIVDLGSTNGTIVNGHRVRRHALTDGDRIVIGTTEITVEHRT